MLKHIAVVLILVSVVGCQQYESTSYVTAPTLTPPAIGQVSPPTGGHQVAPPVYRPPYQSPPPMAGPRAWAPNAPARPWKWIVIHHSDTSFGSAASFDRYHRTVHHWDELGYHFVIGNGNGAPDGLVEVGPRWPKQKWGAHAGVQMYNEFGIGICLVGNFNATRPTAAQMRSLSQLTGYLMRAYRIAPDHVIGHRDAKKTDCPGQYMNIAAVRHMAAAMAGVTFPSGQTLASGEWVHDQSRR